MSTTTTTTARRWEDLVARAHSLGFTVELVEYCESADSPGLLGAGLGVCIQAKRIIRLREKLNLEDRCFVMEHELEHAEVGPDREANREIDVRWHAEQRDMIDAISDRVYGEWR